MFCIKKIWYVKITTLFIILPHANVEQRCLYAVFGTSQLYNQKWRDEETIGDRCTEITCDLLC